MARLSKEERARERRIRKRKLNDTQRELLHALAIIQDADYEDKSFLALAGLVDPQWEGEALLNKDGRDYLKAIDTK